MLITCDFCGQQIDADSTAAALAAGWLTHTITTIHVTFGSETTTEPTSTGFVCRACGDVVSGRVARADQIWETLFDEGAVDTLGGAEYDRRIGGLRDWLRDTPGHAS